MDRRAWQATVLRVAKRWTQLKQLSTYACVHRVANGVELIFIHLFFNFFGETSVQILGPFSEVDPWHNRWYCCCC